MQSVQETSRRMQGMIDRLPTAEELDPLIAKMTHPNWRVPEDKLPKAKALILAGKVGRHPTQDEAYLVQGSAEKPYVVDKVRCTCPSRDLHCKHVTAAELFSRWEVSQYTGRIPQGPRPPRPEGGTPRHTVSPSTKEPSLDALPTPDASPAPAVQDEAALLEERERLSAQKHQIRLLIHECGFVPKSLAEYQDVIMTQTGLTLVPDHFDMIILRLHELLAAQARAPKPVVIPKKYIKQVHGNDHVMYEGLLDLAHQRGLQSLRAEFVVLTETLAWAKATAVFADGREFSEAADATPTNVQKGVKDAWARMALTRAKARALRDGLNIGEAAVEEIS